MAASTGRKVNRRPGAWSDYSRAYRQRLRERCLSMHGGRCYLCRSLVSLEFAHIKPTGLRGSGRGMDRRYRDILRYPDCYALLCKRHHRLVQTYDDFRRLCLKLGRYCDPVPF